MRGAHRDHLREAVFSGLLTRRGGRRDCQVLLARAKVRVGVGSFCETLALLSHQLSHLRCRRIVHARLLKEDMQWYLQFSRRRLRCLHVEADLILLQLDWLQVSNARVDQGAGVCDPETPNARVSGCTWSQVLGVPLSALRKLLFSVDRETACLELMRTYVMRRVA